MEGFSISAVKSDGTVVAWGGNDNGQLGNGTYDNYIASPAGATKVANLSGVASLSFAILSNGDHYSPVSVFALLSDGTVRAWGSNEFGQLGDGTKTDRYKPVPVTGLSGVKAVMPFANPYSPCFDSDCDWSMEGWSAYALQQEGGNGCDGHVVHGSGGREGCVREGDVVGLRVFVGRAVVGEGGCCGSGGGSGGDGVGGRGRDPGQGRGLR